MNGFFFLIGFAGQKVDVCSLYRAFHLIFICIVSRVFSQQRALLHRPSAPHLSHPDCAAGGEEEAGSVCACARVCVCVDGTDCVDCVGDEVTMPNRQQLTFLDPRWPPEPGLHSLPRSSYCESPGCWRTEVALSDWPVPAETISGSDRITTKDTRWETFLWHANTSVHGVFLARAHRDGSSGAITCNSSMTRFVNLAVLIALFSYVLP